MEKMPMKRILSRASSSALLLRKSCPLSPSSPTPSLPLFANRFHSLSAPSIEAPVLQHLLCSTPTFQRFGFSTSASKEQNEKKEQGLDTEGDTVDLSKDDLVKLVTERATLLEAKQKELAAMKDQCLGIYAETENVMDRASREAENSKKFAIQVVNKIWFLTSNGLLDVADNLRRTSSVVKENFAKLDVSHGASRVVPLLKTLLEGVEMTQKQLLEGN